MVDCLHHRKPLQNNQNEIERIGDKVQKRKKYSKGRDQDWENMMCKRIRYVGRTASTFRQRRTVQGEVKGEGEEANRTPIIKSPVAFH